MSVKTQTLVMSIVVGHSEMVHDVLIGILVALFVTILIVFAVMWCINGLCCCKNKGFLVREIEAMDRARARAVMDDWSRARSRAMDVEMAGIQSGILHAAEWSRVEDERKVGAVIVISSSGRKEKFAPQES
jgi:hypothetical protein